MSKQLQVFKCKGCGMVLEGLHQPEGEAELSCCGEPLALLKENTVDAAKEKHVPVIEKMSDGYKVKIGSEPHPMLPEHYIEWIQLIADGKACRQFLKPGDAPEAVFKVSASEVSARELCNIHGLWKS